ncbi:MAG: hypothetical protein ABII88_10695 [Candidatus Omnitrophota bacterium]
MINLELSQVVAVYVLLFIMGFLGAWTFSFLKNKVSRDIIQYKLCQCAICTFVYSTVMDMEMTICPRCGSYNKKEEVGG